MLPGLYLHHYQPDLLCSLTKNLQSGAGISAQHDNVPPSSGQLLLLLLNAIFFHLLIFQS